MSMYRNKLDEIEQKLQEAYRLIREADTTDIDAFYLAVEEAQGYVAESLDMMKERG
jgi:predicted nucleic acid-binding protein